MEALKTILLTVKRHRFQIQQSVLKQAFSNSTVWNISNLEHRDECVFDNDKNVDTQNKKLLKVAMLGLPNSGKSTLVNQLMHRSICPTSSKVHTTIHKAEAIYTEKDVQIIFIDTPGLVNAHEMKQYKLPETYVKDPQNSAAEADVIGVIQDVTNVYTRHIIANGVIEYLNNRKRDAQLLLILNKVDKLKKKNALLEVTNILISNKDYPKFNDIFMISALNGDGVDDLRNYLIDSAKVQNWKYDMNLYTDQPVEIIIQQTVRAKLMDMLPYEMPYKIKVTIEHLDYNDDGNLHTVVRLDCPKSNYVKYFLKHKASNVKCLAFYVEKELSNAYRTNISVRINVHCAGKV